ncbi:MAG: rhomboid family intramembrane serine protease [Acidobacteria bacterium]|nr:rhomboid family intramembrane serine protease [Acidobacteriota bacterium]
MAPAPKTNLDAARKLGSLLPENGQLIVYILAVNGFLYLAMALFNQQNTRGGGFFDLSGSTLFLFGAKEPSYIFHGEWWRLVTAGFLHASIIHIAMNSWGLYDLGAQAEEAFGPGRLLVIYVGSSITGFLASCYSPSLSVGASAGIFGLIGAMIAFGINQRSSFGSYVKSAYTRTAVWALLISFMIPYTDNWAHIGGLAGGFAIAYLAGHPRLSHPRQERYWNIAGLGVSAFVLICFVVQFFTTLKYLQS